MMVKTLHIKLSCGVLRMVIYKFENFFGDSLVSNCYVCLALHNAKQHAFFCSLLFDEYPLLFDAIQMSYIYIYFLFVVPD